MSHNHLKIEQPEIGNRCHGYQNVRTMCYLQGETLGQVYFMSIYHLWTLRVNLRCDIENLWLFGPISGHKTRVTKTVNLYSYLRFCGNIMCTAGPNGNLWLTKATGMDKSGSGMPNDSNFALFWQWGVLWVHMGAKWRPGNVVVMVILEIKITVFTCLPGTHGCDRFPRHLDLALASKQQMKGLRANGTSVNMINCGALSLV